MTDFDFSAETWDKAVAIFDGGWVIASKHSPALNSSIELNNRTFVFRLKNKAGSDVLFVLGCGNAATIDAVKELEKDTGLSVTWVVSTGGAHHLFLDLWYQAFPEARLPIPAKRIPFTRNGQQLAKKYADRWELMEGPRPQNVLDEFGDQIDIVIFDQLFGYKDETSAKAFDGGAADHSSTATNFKGFKLMMRMGPLMKDVSQPNDEVTFFHKKTGLVVGGHNFQFAYTPKGFKPDKEFTMKMGGFPMSIMMKMMMFPKGVFKSTYEGPASPIADSAAHWDQWQKVLEWDMKAWTSAHNTPTICGPEMTGDEPKAAIRESLKRSGEDDPSGASLKWNKKHKKAPTPQADSASANP
jgi:hypothetical protein